MPILNTLLQRADSSLKVSALYKIIAWIVRHVTIIAATPRQEP